MSEELLQTVPYRLDRYEYYKLGSSTLRQLQENGIIPQTVPLTDPIRKPDGLIVVQNGSVKASIEYKPHSRLTTQDQWNIAITQAVETARGICPLAIVSDGENTRWIRVDTGQEITHSNGDSLAVFDARAIISNALTIEELRVFEELIDRVSELSEEEHTLVDLQPTDPSPLAKKIWQKIWIHTGQNPERCLYNVVELFVFRFLSDVGILSPPYDFDSVYQHRDNPEDALKQYARNCRPAVRDLFPPGEDNTTIINGTIFVNERGNPNLAQARLFGEVLEDLHLFTTQHGSFRLLPPEFKTRLYESFLRQEAGIRLLGQFFTPRTVAMVEMSPARYLRPGARICDPFCGVGGFLLETIASCDQIKEEFKPRNGEVAPRITMVGYDKGTDEQEDERTIILAKANMLIYFSDLLLQYHSSNHLKAFAKGGLNQVFRLLRSNLGTFEVKDEPYDLILTNPPYVTSGSQSLKEAIQERGLSTRYTSGGRGTEALAIEWIVRHLKPEGQALLIVPDGLLNQIPVLTWLQKNCVIQGIVSLPPRTFFSTPKQTYILSLRRKRSDEGVQLTPVFVYLVSEIGESRDARRWSLEQNDLISMTAMYNQFISSPHHFQSSSLRCKVLPFEELRLRSHWMAARWWTDQEREELGLELEPDSMSVSEFDQNVEDIRRYLADQDPLSEEMPSTTEFKELPLGDKNYFQLSLGKRIMEEDHTEEGYLVYSANVTAPVGNYHTSRISDFSAPSVLWGIDGNFVWGYVDAEIPFAPTDHCGVLRVKHPGILPKFFYYALRSAGNAYGFDRTHRASLRNMKEQVVVQIPIDERGCFDLEAQERFISLHEKLDAIQSGLADKLTVLSQTHIALQE